MLSISRNIYVDDIIMEYAILKVECGYNPYFTSTEFINFLRSFNEKFCVKDIIYDPEKLFTRFFDRKIETIWTKYSFINRYPLKTIIPHLEMEYDNNINDFIIYANYELSFKDLDNLGTSYLQDVEIYKIREFIKKYLRRFPKRKIDTDVSFNDQQLNVGKNISAEILLAIWNNYIKDMVKQRKWPKQCSDIYKYLFEVDLASIISEDSLKDKFFNFYNDVSINIAKLYNENNNLIISSDNNNLLAYSNYCLVFEKYVDLMDKYFKYNLEGLFIDLSVLQYRGQQKIGMFVNINGDRYNKKEILLSDSDERKKLIKQFEYK